MPKLELKILGLKQLEKNLRKYPAISIKHLQKALRFSMAELSREERPPVMPVDTGNLMRKTILGLNNPQINVLSARATINVKYAEYVHEGTAKMRARPFIDEGFIKAKKKIEGRFKDALDAINKEVAKV